MIEESQYADISLMLPLSVNKTLNKILITSNPKHIYNQETSQFTNWQFGQCLLAGILVGYIGLGFDCISILVGNLVIDNGNISEISTH